MSGVNEYPGNRNIFTDYSGTGEIKIEAGKGETLLIKNATTTFPNGTEALPSITFTNDTSTGLSYSTDVLNTSVGGTYSLKTRKNVFGNNILSVGENLDSKLVAGGSSLRLAESSSSRSCLECDRDGAGTYLVCGDSVSAILNIEFYSPFGDTGAIKLSQYSGGDGVRCNTGGSNLNLFTANTDRIKIDNNQTEITNNFKSNNAYSKSTILNGTSTQSIPTNIPTNITIWPVPFTEVGVFKPTFSAVTGSYTVIYPGVYVVNCSTGFQINGTGSRSCSIVKGSNVVAYQSIIANGTDRTSFNLSCTELCGAGDVFVVNIFQSSGGALLTDDAIDSIFSIYRIG